MKSFRAEEYLKRSGLIDGWDVGITTYRILDKYVCLIDNVSPGATIARAAAATPEAAHRRATEVARARLATTHRR